MRSLRVSENFVPISEFKAQAADWLRKASETGDPVVVTQNGKPAGVLLSPQAFDELTERAQFVYSVQRGLDDVEAGRVQSHQAVAERMEERYGQDRVSRRERFVSAVHEGLADMEAGRVITDEELGRRLDERFDAAEKSKKKSKK